MARPRNGRTLYLMEPVSRSTVQEIPSFVQRRAYFRRR